jgi:hypothetical protein
MMAQNKANKQISVAPSALENAVAIEMVNTIVGNTETIPNY